MITTSHALQEWLNYVVGIAQSRLLMMTGYLTVLLDYIDLLCISVTVHTKTLGRQGIKIARACVHPGLPLAIPVVYGVD